VVVGQQKGLQVSVEFVSILVMEALHGRLFNGAIHALNLPVGPRVGPFRQPVLYPVFAANAVKAVSAGQELVRLGRELHPIVRQHGMHLVRQLVEHAPQKLGRDHAFGPRVQLCKGYFAGAVNGHKEVLAAFFGLALGETNVQVVHRVVLELLFRQALFVSVRGQAADAVALETAVQRRVRQVRNRGLQRVQAVVQRQQGMLAKGYGNSFLLGAEHRRRRFGAYASVLNGGPLAPLGHRFRIDAEACG
jgi:hypothetical protein